MTLLSTLMRGDSARRLFIRNVHESMVSTQVSGTNLSGELSSYGERLHSAIYLMTKMQSKVLKPAYSKGATLEHWKKAKLLIEDLPDFDIVDKLPPKPDTRFTGTTTFLMNLTGEDGLYGALSDMNIVGAPTEIINGIEDENGIKAIIKSVGYMNAIKQSMDDPNKLTEEVIDFINSNMAAMMQLLLVMNMLGVKHTGKTESMWAMISSTTADKLEILLGDLIEHFKVNRMHALKSLKLWATSPVPHVDRLISVMKQETQYLNILKHLDECTEVWNNMHTSILKVV